MNLRKRNLLPYCIICGLEISEEEFTFFEDKCIDCVHGPSTEEGFKLITAIFMGFFGVIFFISSFSLLFQIIFNSHLRSLLRSALGLPLILLFLISITLMSFAIKKFRSSISLEDIE